MANPISDSRIEDYKSVIEPSLNHQQIPEQNGEYKG